MKLNTIIILSFLLVAMIGSFVGSYYFYAESNEILEERVSAHLATTAHSRTHHIDTFLNEQKGKIELMASSFIFKKIFDKNQSNYQYTLETVCDRINAIIKLEKNIYELFILDINGKIICSSSKENIGLDKSYNDYFTEGLKATYIKDPYYSETTGKNSIAFSAPISHDEENYVGVIVARMEISVLNEILEDNTGLGKFGEIYLINKDSYMVTDSKFKEDTFLKEKIDSINAKNCLSLPEFQKKDETIVYGEDYHIGHEESSIYSNYRGIIVLGTHHHSHTANWCLIAEINEAEIFGETKNEILLESLIVGGILALISILIGFILAYLITKPIKELTKNVNEITKGKLDIELKKNNIFEVQELTDSLNRILVSLKLAIMRTGATKGELGLGETIKAKEKAEQRFKDIALASGDWIWETDKNGIYTFVSGKIKDILGYSPKEIIGKTPFDFMPKKEAIKIKKDFQKIIAEKAPIQNLPNWNITKKGKRVLLLTNATPILNNEGNLIGYRGVDKDITKLNEAEKKYKTLYESSRDAIVIIEPPKWNFTAGNPSAIKMFGVRNEKEFISKSPKDFSPKKQPNGEFSSKKYLNMINIALKKGSNSFKCIHKRLDGEEFLATVLFTKMRLKGKNVIQATIRDVTKTK